MYGCKRWGVRHRRHATRSGRRPVLDPQSVDPRKLAGIVGDEHEIAHLDRIVLVVVEEDDRIALDGGKLTSNAGIIERSVLPRFISADAIGSGLGSYAEDCISLILVSDRDRVFREFSCADELGALCRGRYLDRRGEGALAGLGSVEAAIFALMGLILAFTISGALQRFDERRQLILKEVSAVSSAYDRIDLLDDEARAELKAKLKNYFEARIKLYRDGIGFSFTEGTRSRVTQPIGNSCSSKVGVMVSCGGRLHFGS